MMNCNDVRRLLDEGEMSAPPATLEAELDSHVSECEACAAQCLASERVSSFRSAAPPMPESLRQRARQLQDLAAPVTSRRPTRRPVIIGSLLLFGAAATMLSVVPWRDASAANR